jgi:hypothetical protein
MSNEPPVMWPSQGSGFEADPFSPAGTAQREWMLTQRLGRTRWGKLFVWLILLAFVTPLVIAFISTVFH